jgi:5-methylcytosine-specific restriction endonuclease McrA
MRRGDPRNGRPYQRLKAALRGEQPCWLCHELILDDVDWRHPLSRTIDHIVPVTRGGDPLNPANCLPAHRRCNNRRQTKPVIPQPSRRPW